MRQEKNYEKPIMEVFAIPEEPITVLSGGGTGGDKINITDEFGGVF